MTESQGPPADAGEVTLPPGTAELWQPAGRPRRGPRPGLSVEAITRAAIDIADGEGLAAVSMARVAKALGVTTMALYRYVASKEALLALMLDAIAPLPEEPEDPALPWRVRLETWCRDQLALFVEHPWMGQLVGVAAVGPNRVGWIERGLRALEDVRVSEGLKTAIVGRLSLHLLTEGQMLVAMRAADAGADSDHPALLDFNAMLRAVTNPQDHPAITAALDAGAFSNDGPNDVDDAGLGLTILLDGVEALLRRAAPGG
ncbi:TetR/AcrR family transcriptional regulator [Georgenia thermotolerans]|uniref:TetR family transcriptional regulator n=1 Tax=Georgenia thermotolerans TaxID=527326 RepID=A0A7J5UUP8_9MICO|nr:TetR/AcrR family transcriptional regulator [Georgenia thermotolerans]KAE8766021.1 TetR family transcriptional regulator [Georgenia thermotolerans]